MSTKFKKELKIIRTCGLKHASMTDNETFEACDLKALLQKFIGRN